MSDELENNKYFKMAEKLIERRKNDEEFQKKCDEIECGQCGKELTKEDKLLYKEISSEEIEMFMLRIELTAMKIKRKEEIEVFNEFLSDCFDNLQTKLEEIWINLD